MKILVTGHRGFVGTHMLRQLAGKHEIFGLDIADNPAADARDFFRHDRNSKFDVIIHLAAVIGGRAMIDGDPLKVAVDLAIDAEMFQWALRTRPKHVFYFSSSAAYPVTLQVKDREIRLAEDHIDFGRGVFGTPDMTYGWSKLTGEMQAQFVAGEGIPVTIFRPFSGYGSDQATDYPFPSFVDRAVERPEHFEIWGDPTSQRDWIHIDDIVRATELAMDERITGTFNLATGIATPFTELATKICSVIGYTPEIVSNGAKPMGVHTRVADIEHMSTWFTPLVSLDQGIERAVADRVHNG